MTAAPFTVCCRELAYVSAGEHVERTMGLAARLSLVPEYQGRRAERLAVDLDAGMRELGATGDDVRIHNLSTHGFMAEADQIYPVGAYVWLRLAGVGRLNAQIIWRDCFRYGCEFVTPLSIVQCAAAIAAGARTEA